ncbi:MAG: DUF2207 domain-containing protein [Rhodobiaceae bacterium]|nr:DUF2207 domain-containing protein [Rhodobiaceae bacterium]
MRILYALVVGLALLALPARAEEVIRDFHSDIVVRADGVLEVTEGITVDAEGREIRRGIYRDFPTRYKTDNGLFTTVGFKVKEVLRDGRPEPWFTENQPGGVRVYIGDKDTYLRPGTYVYTLKYETSRQIRHLDDRDELYWNVTGTDWQFTILQASAKVILPEGAIAGDTAVYTGRYGDTEGRAESEIVGPRTVTFQTTRLLGPHQGLTIAVGFQKGIVANDQGGAIRTFLDNIGLGVAGGGLAVVIAYFLAMWDLVGRDPEKGVVIPRFKPPEGLSPAAVSYIYYRGFKSRMRGVPRAFVAALMSLAVKRHIDLDENAKVVSIKALKPIDIDAPPGEAAIYDYAFTGRSKMLSFTKANGVFLKAMMSKFSGVILGEYGSRFFHENRVVFAIGAVISVAAVFAAIVLYRGNDNEIGGLIATIIGSAGTAVVLAFGVRRLRGSVPGGSTWVGLAATAFGVLLLLTFAASFVISAPWPYIVLRLAIAAVIFLNIAFFHLLTAPTVLGQKLMDEIEGFRMYLSVAEAERMNMAGAPDFTTDLYERYLPYAIGLGVEKPWSEALEEHLRKTGGTTEYRPGFYRGSNWNSGRIAASTAALASTVGSSIASAMPAPKSSGSGSSGGGFSGGGGGGGGGGGW